jgi:glutamate racemase
VVRRSLIQNSVVVETLAENVELADADRIVLACNHHDSLRRSLGALLEHFSEHTCAGEAGHSGKTYWRGECANHPESAFNRARAALADVSK